MSTLKDKLKEAQGSGTTVPKLDIVGHFDVKLDESKNKIGFHFYDKEEEDKDKRDKFFHNSVQGIYIGHALKITAFDQAINNSYYSSTYFTNKDIVVLFGPTAQGPAKMITGTPEAIDKWLGEKRLTPKRQLLYFVLTHKGLVSVKSNLILSIGQFQNRVNNVSFRDALLDHMLVLTPMEYDPNDKQWSVSTKKFLGPFADKNRPKFASASLGDEFSEDDLVSMKAEAVIDQYKAWKEFKTKSPEKAVPGEEAPESPIVHEITPGPAPLPEPTYKHPQPPTREPDDLPF